jgi:hypothetical protein
MLYAQSSYARKISAKDISMLAQGLHIPSTWRLSKSMMQPNRDYPNTHCTVFHSRTTKKWIGKLCLTANKKYISDMGIHDEVPEEEDWADRSQYEVGYWSVTPLAIYPMTPFILKPIKNYAAESDCHLDDGPVYRATSMCHTTLYELRKGVFIYSVFHVFDNVKHKQKVQVSDIRNLWIQVGGKISKQSSH